MFSVVIPVFNHERYLTECVLSATRSPLVGEVLLLDDGSTDRSPQLAKQLSGSALPKVRDVTQPARGNRGAHATLNELVELASSEWVAVLNSDDVFPPSRFELIARRLRYRQFDLAFGNVLIIDQHSRQLGGKRAMFDPQLPLPTNFDVAGMAAKADWLPLLAHQNFLATTSNMVFRKSLFEKLGGFRDFRYVHDWDFCLRAALTGSVEYIPHALVTYRVHAANTIKEDGTRVDKEVQAMFERVIRDHPALEQNEAFEEGLAANPYLKHRAEPVLSLMLPPGEGRELYGLAAQQALKGIEITDAEPTGQYVYAPTSLFNALTPIHLRNAALAIEMQQLDFVVVSHTLADPPQIGTHSREDAQIARRGKTEAQTQGVIARLFPGGGSVSDFSTTIVPPVPRTQPLPTLLRSPPDGKPIVLILPALFAVGGVERLIIDMMRQLSDRYRFVIITVERLHSRQGSLHGPAVGAAIGFYDLAELAAPAIFLPMIERLREVYKPALVWIPNGSPWQCDHASEIRRIFSDIPIVDQQVYDTEAGWISRYHDPGIQSYDRFIAINRKIEQTLIHKYGIAPNRIDMIYHSVNLRALGPIRRLPQNPPVFGWVGRFTFQKRPLEFLEFVRQTPDHRFMMIGDGELGGAADAFIAQHELANVTRIRFSDKMGDLFATMHGLLSSSEYEGLPISMLEALAMGVPIYSTDVGDVALILAEYDAGIVTSPRWDLPGYKAGFEAWVTDLDRYRENALAAAPLIRERFGSPAVADQYEQSFNRVLAALSPENLARDQTYPNQLPH